MALSSKFAMTPKPKRSWAIVGLNEMAQDRGDLPSLSPAIDHFLKVTTSYAPGLFHCYAVPDLPRTNNELEQFFGSARYLERRATGKKTASPAFVVRVVAAVASSHQPFKGTDLRPIDLAKWRQLRAALKYRHDARRAQLRFRRDPQSYLARLEKRLFQPGLPP